MLHSVFVIIFVSNFIRQCHRQVRLGFYLLFHTLDCHLEGICVVIKFPEKSYTKSLCQPVLRKVNKFTRCKTTLRPINT